MSLSSGLLIWVPIAFGVLVIVLGTIFLGVLLPAARKAAAADFARQVMKAEAAEEAQATAEEAAAAAATEDAETATPSADDDRNA